MRPNAMILLFYALFLSTCTARHRGAFGPSVFEQREYERMCASTVERIENKETEYNPKSKWLSCSNKAHALMAIVWNSKRYRALQCAFPKPWRGVDEPARPTTPEEDGFMMGMEMINPMVVECVEYCTVTGTGVESYVEETLKAKCANDGRIYINNAPIDTPRLKCTFNGGWAREDNTQITAETETPLQVECKMPCIQGDRPEGIVTTIEDGKTVFKCNKPTTDRAKYGVSINGGIANSYFKCDKKGFKDVMNNVVFADAYEAVKLECAIGVPCSFEPEDSMVHFDDSSKTLSCNGGDDKLMAIEFISKRYESLRCHESDGWKHGSTLIADAFNRIRVKCVEYCAVIGDKIPNTMKSGDRTVSCHEDTRELKDDAFDAQLILLVNNKPTKHARSYALCTLNNGWMQSEGYEILTDDSASPVRVECKRACAKTTNADGVRSKPFADLNSYLINQFECGKSDAANGDKYGVRINNGLVHTKIVCGAAGYTVEDANGLNLASAFEDASFGCALLPTTTTSTTTTTTPAPTTTTVPETTTKKVEKFRPKNPLKPTRKDGENSGRKNDDDEEENHEWIKNSVSSISIYSIIFILVGYGNI